MKFKFDIQRFSINKTVELINNWRIYEEGKDVFDGATSVEVAGLSTKTAEVAGIGILGTIDAPVECSFEGIEATINWRAPTAKAITITGGQPISLECWVDIQYFDSGSGKVVHAPMKIVIRGRGKNYEGGSIEAGNTSDGSNTIETHYLKYMVDGKETLLLDKYNHIFRVNGVDRMKQIRKNIGMN